MTEYIDSISNAFRNRFTSPIFGNFVISWLLWNPKLVYITLFVDNNRLLYAGELVNKYEYLQLYGYINIWNGLLLPIASTIAFILLYPIILREVERYNEKQKIKRDNDKLVANETRLIDYHKFTTLYKEHEQTKLENEGAVEKIYGFQEKVKELESKLKKEQSNIHNLKFDNNNLRRSLDTHIPTINSIFSDSVWTVRDRETNNIIDTCSLDQNILTYSDRKYFIRKVNYITSYDNIAPMVEITFEKISKKDESGINCKIKLDQSSDYFEFILEEGGNIYYYTTEQTQTEEINNPCRNILKLDTRKLRTYGKISDQPE